MIDNKIKVDFVYPAPTSNSAPDFVPEEVSRIFVQARNAHVRRDFDIAAMGYRKALEIALKIFDPNVKGLLGPRIDALAAKQALTPGMKDWAHEVRLIANEGTHEPHEPTDADLDDLFLFTESALEYLYTLPKKIEGRRAQRKKT